MFVYQNKLGNVCITFTGNLPVENPEYEIVVDEANKQVALVGADCADAVAVLREEHAAEVAKLEADLAAEKVAREAAEKRVAELEKDLEA